MIDILVENIKRICRERLLTMYEVEEKAGIPKSTMSRWNDHKPSIDKVQRVAAILGVTIDELLKE